MMLDFPKDVAPFILDGLSLPEVIHYSQIDKTCKDVIGTQSDMASLYGLRENCPESHLASLKLIANNPNPLAIGRVIDRFPFLLECYYSTATVGGPQSTRESAVKCLRQVMPTALQIFLSLLKHGSLHGKWAKAVMRSVDIILHIACSTVDEELVPDDEQYLIADCVEVIVTLGALYSMDPRASLEHLNAWTKFYVSYDAVKDLADRKRELKSQGRLSIHASEFLASVLEGLEDPESDDD